MLGSDQELISLDGGATWRLPVYERLERERLERVGRALNSFHPYLYETFSKMVNHVEGDELQVSSGVTSAITRSSRLQRARAIACYSIVKLQS